MAETTIEYNVTTNVEGNGHIELSRYGDNNNTLEFTAVGDEHYHFTKFIIRNYRGYLKDNEDDYIVTEMDPLSSSNTFRIVASEGNTEFNENPMILTANQDISITAYFEEDTKYHIYANTNAPHTSVYISVNDQYEPFTTVLWARPFPDYQFNSWSDGITENPRSMYIDRDTSIVAEYTQVPRMDGLYEYRCYVKDQANLTDLPKAFLKVKSFRTSNDLMTRANSTISVYDPPETIDNGDVLVLYDPKGMTLYTGVIKSIEIVNEHEKTISCSQMQSFYKGTWVYEKGETPPETYDNSWYWEKYAKIEATYPHIDDVDALSPAATSTYADTATWRINAGDNYTARATTYLWCDKPTIAYVTFVTEDNGAVYINDNLLTETQATAETVCELALVKGMNKIVVLYSDASSYDGWNMFLNYQSFPAYDSTKTYAVGDYVGYSEAIYQCKTAITTPEKWTAGHWNKITTKLRVTILDHILGLNSTKSTDLDLEKCVANIVNYYASGNIVGSDYTDPIIAQRLSGITVRYIGSTMVNLPTYSVGETMDFEDFIYYLYEHYGIVFEFEINVSGYNYVTIRIPDYAPVKVGDNIFAITNMNPVTTTEETNRLIIFAGDNVTYRATWVATETGVFEATSEEATRMKVTNTEIVFSDDPIGDIVANNLPSQMYNHNITFDLILKNFIYDFNQFKIGGPLHIYTIDDYYDSVLTGYEINKNENTNIDIVTFVCGKVRQKLTQLLTLKKI